ncbi:DUF2461 domain-containing protein [Flectobacillus major]|jgi:uncharacterized protein (TIGR02453 family)|uniref:DUF2461 domain-containing protein n=1 Tax=Flectobacillus major TaxID=103 RepID=UPI0004206C00|nr:DUF2461 domain-containing protein [Flectobacillus major]
MAISQETFDYLNQLKINNNREWFHANKKQYDSVKASFEENIQNLIHSIGTFENMTGVKVKDCNYRIARDVRFSPNKDPYKTWLSASFSEGGRKSGRMDYYLHIQDGESFLGGGMYSPTPEQLALFRQEIDYNAEHLKGIIYNPTFVKTFGTPVGESVKTSPKGYDKNHPEIELLRMKQMFFWKKFTNEEVISSDFERIVTQSCLVLKPYLDYLNAIFFDHEEPVIQL